MLTSIFFLLFRWFPFVFNSFLFFFFLRIWSLKPLVDFRSDSTIDGQNLDFLIFWLLHRPSDILFLLFLLPSLISFHILIFIYTFKILLFDLFQVLFNNWQAVRKLLHVFNGLLFSYETVHFLKLIDYFDNFFFLLLGPLSLVFPLNISFNRNSIFFLFVNLILLMSHA